MCKRIRQKDKETEVFDCKDKETEVFDCVMIIKSNITMKRDIFLQRRSIHTSLPCII